MTVCPCGRAAITSFPFDAITPHDIPDGVISCRHGDRVYFHEEEQFMELNGGASE